MNIFNNEPDSFAAGLERKEAEEREEERREAEEEAERLRCMALARADYEQHKREEEQEECPHDEHDHGICLSCGADILDDLIDRAELLRDE